MSDARTTFIKELFQSISTEHYLSVKYILDQPELLSLRSDLDLLMEEPLIAKVHHFCTKHPLVISLRKEQQQERTTIKLYLIDGGFLKLDLLRELCRKTLCYLPSENLYKYAIESNGVKTYHPLHLFEHVVLYYFLNGSGIPNQYLAYFQDLPKAINSVLLPYFNQKYGTKFTYFEELTNASHTIKKQLIQQLKKLPENQLHQQLKRAASLVLSRCTGTCSSWGKIITFSGVDGAGKTTLLLDLKQRLVEQHDCKVIVLRHRPGLLPILSAWSYGKKGAEARSMAQLPRQGNNQHKLGSAIRFMYYFLDYLIGQWWVQLRYCSQGYIVIYDRYYFDFMADARRSNIQLSHFWPRQLYRFLLAPQLNVFLYADAEMILNRKQELEHATIEELTSSYKQLFTQLKQKSGASYQLIKNEDQARSMKEIMQWYNQQIA
jgi:thymidylate kinase